MWPASGGWVGNYGILKLRVTMLVIKFTKAYRVLANPLSEISITMRCWSFLKLHSHQTADQPPINADQFLWLDRVWSGKNDPLWLKSVSIPDQLPLYPRCIPDAPTLKSRSSRPTPVLPADPSPLCTTNPWLIPDATTLTTLKIDQPPIWFPFPA